IREAAAVDHPGVAASHRILGRIAVSRGELEVARTHFDAAVDGARRTRGDRHPDVVDGLRQRAELSLRQDDLAGAVADYEAALEAREGITLPPATVAGLQWALGRHLLELSPQARARAVDLVRQAQRGYPAEADEHAAISTWLDAHAEGVAREPSLQVEAPGGG
ncbi:MAG: tetratricopeptide repeat protein, partial [Myxococcota bacterium]